MIFIFYELKERVDTQMNLDIRIVNPILKEEHLPKYSTESSAGIDLRACISNPISIGPNQTVLIGTGIAIDMQSSNMFGMCVPRSGLGTKGIILGNGTGIIDSDYQGEIMLPLWNRSNKDFIINPFDRVAQLLFLPIIRIDSFNIVEQFKSKTERSINGFGSTGVN